MKDTIMGIGLGLLAIIFLSQRFLRLRQKTAQMFLRVQDNDGVYLFTSARCPICARMKKLHVASIEQGRIVVRDVMEHPPLVAQYRIMTVPTTLVIRSGTVAQVWYGLVQHAVLSPWL